MSTKKRKVYDVQTKQNIIDDFNNKEKNKETIDDIMKKYDIRTTSTFYTIINPKNQENLKNVMHLKSLKIYFQANPSNCSDYLDGIMKMENFIANEMNKNKKQDVIENYFIKN